VIVTQLTLLEAVQLHPAGVTLLTVKLNDPPGAETVLVAGESETN
jgi:hypothetical protein